jgi:hypothetical protein
MINYLFVYNHLTSLLVIFHFHLVYYLLTKFRIPVVESVVKAGKTQSRQKSSADRQRHATTDTRG